MSEKADEVLTFIFVAIVLFSAESFGLLLAVAIATAFVGQVIGENNTLLTLYIIGAMTFSYIIPLLLVLTLRFKNVIRAFGVIFVACTILAIPSSFVAKSGCENSNERAMWALRAVPILWIGDQLVAPHGENLTCRSWENKP